MSTAGAYGLSLSVAVPESMAIAKAGDRISGHLVEAVLLRLCERGDPEWAAELDFDAESDGCVVRCRRKTPLRFLERRLEALIADPKKLRRLTKSLPDDLA